MYLLGRLALRLWSCCSVMDQEFFFCGTAHFIGAILHDTEQQQAPVIVCRLAAGHGQVDKLLTQVQYLLNVV